jgi:hypothetical protein
MRTDPRGMHAPFWSGWRRRKAQPEGSTPASAAGGQTQERDVVMDEPKVPAGTEQVCYACGAATGANTALSYERRGDAWFCDDCWQHLPAHEVERIVREVALRGVPL